MKSQVYRKQNSLLTIQYLVPLLKVFLVLYSQGQRTKFLHCNIIFLFSRAFLIQLSVFFFLLSVFLTSVPASSFFAFISLFPYFFAFVFFCTFCALLNTVPLNRTKQFNGLAASSLLQFIRISLELFIRRSQVQLIVMNDLNYFLIPLIHLGQSHL